MRLQCAINKYKQCTNKNKGDKIEDYSEIITFNSMSKC